jgi:hypothetical protein
MVNLLIKEKTMFTTDAIIDSVQTARKNMINTFVNHEATKEALINYIDVESEYTKKAAKVGTDTFAKLSNETIKLVKESAKFDWVKATQDAVESFKTTSSKK